MADTKISALTDGTTADATDRLPVARSPFGASDNRYITPSYIATYLRGLANTWSLAQTFSSTLNKITMTAPATGATLTLDDGSTLATSGANSITLTSSGATNVTLPTSGTLAALGGTNTWTAANTFSLNGAVSTSPVSLTGSIYTGGTGTTTKPYHLIEPSGAVAPSTWSTSGTAFGINSGSGFVGNFVDFHVNGAASVFAVSYTGAATVGSLITPIVRVSNINNNNNANTVLTFTNSSDNLLFATGGTSPRINFCGTTSSFPALKRSSAALETKLADDSAYGQHNMLLLGLVDGVTAPSATVGLAKIYVDTADGDLKVIFGDGVVKTISVDT